MAVAVVHVGVVGTRVYRVGATNHETPQLLRLR